MEDDGWQSFIKRECNKETVLDTIFTSLKTEESKEFFISLLSSVDEDNRFIDGILHFLRKESSKTNRSIEEVIDEILQYRRFIRTLEAESHLCSAAINLKINDRRRKNIRYMKRTCDDMISNMRDEKSYIPQYIFKDLSRLDTERILCLIG